MSIVFARNVLCVKSIESSRTAASTCLLVTPSLLFFGEINSVVLFFSCIFIWLTSSVSDGKGWHGNMERQKRLAATAPPTEERMMR